MEYKPFCSCTLNIFFTQTIKITKGAYSHEKIVHNFYKKCRTEEKSLQRGVSANDKYG